VIIEFNKTDNFFCINDGNEINYAPFNKGQHCAIRLSA